MQGIVLCGVWIIARCRIAHIISAFLIATLLSCPEDSRDLERQHECHVAPLDHFEFIDHVAMVAYFPASSLGLLLLCLIAPGHCFMPSSPKYSSSLRKSLSMEMEESIPERRVFIFGLGYVGAEVATTLAKEPGFRVCGTCTNVKKMEYMRSLGIRAYLFDSEAGKMVQSEAIDDLLNSTHLLCTIPPIGGEDPVLRTHGNDIRKMCLNGVRLEWVGYLSSTGVYGDREGAWVTEDDEVSPNNAKTKARYAAELAWSALKEKVGLPVHIFRLAGIYGPGRSAIDTLNKAAGDMRECGADDRTFISRIHVDDICAVLKASMLSPSPGFVVNVADDLPSTLVDFPPAIQS